MGLLFKPTKAQKSISGNLKDLLLEERPVDHLSKLVEVADIARPQALEIMARTEHALGQWECLGKGHGVDKANIRPIKSRMAQIP